MKVEKIYQDSEGNWHIDYGLTYLMSLAIRVYFGQIFLAFTMIFPLLILSALMGFTFGQSLPKENNSSSLDVRQDFIKGWSTKCPFLVKDNAPYQGIQTTLPKL